jgi:exodeoxyribonuclease VII large subunit
VADDRPEVTWSVTELHEAVKGLLGHAFGTRVWVTGELRSLHRSAAGHTYFDLVEPGSDGAPGSAHLAVTLFSGHRQRVNATVRRHGDSVRIAEGTILRIGGELTTYPAASRLQLVMTAIDPAYTLAVTQQQRDRTMAALAAEGLLERNGRLPVPHPPLHLALVTSRNSAAEADVLSELERSGMGFRVRRIDARTQGAEAEALLVAALRTAESLEVDVVLLVRGGGSRTDLGVFDSERLARTIAGLGVPVVTGIGHETDRSVADEVAHSAHKTPTAAAASVVERARRARRELDEATGALATAARGRLLRAGAELGAASRTASVACRGHLAREAQGLEDRLARVLAAAPRSVDRRGAALAAAIDRLPGAGRASLGRAATRLGQLEALVAARDPAHLLAAGWSITRTAEGDLVTTPEGLAPGTVLSTTVSGGRLTSVVADQGGDRGADRDH